MEIVDKLGGILTPYVVNRLNTSIRMLTIFGVG